MRFKDIINQRFGKLTVVRKCGTRGRGRNLYWRCKCDCGKERECDGSKLRKGVVTSCGCVNHGKTHCQFNGCEDITGNYWGRLKKGAIKRDLPFEITVQEAWALFLEQGRKCALTGWELKFATTGSTLYPNTIQTASLDRIDSNKGYIAGNVQWVHKDVNMAKQAKSDIEFIELCKAVVSFRLIHPTKSPAC